MTAGEVILETRGLSKSFAGFLAVSDVNLRVRRKTVHALIGPNGAGKTTVFNMLTRFLSASSGQIFYKGQEITRRPAADIARSGLVRSFQISAVFPHLTARENVRVALQRRQGTHLHFWRSGRSLSRLDARADDLLDSVGLAELRGRVAKDLSYGRKRALEIATTLALDPEMLLLDEPMAGLGREDIEGISRLIGVIARDRTVLMVEHNLSVVAALSHEITVLQLGKVLAEGDYRTIAANPAVIEAYLGRGHV